MLNVEGKYLQDSQGNPLRVKLGGDGRTIVGKLQLPFYRKKSKVFLYMVQIFELFDAPSIPRSCASHLGLLYFRSSSDSQHIAGSRDA